MKMMEPYNTLIKKLVDALERKYGDRLVSVIVFGSVARGEARKDSDIDLLLIVESLPKSKLERQKEFIEIEAELEEYLNKLDNYFIDFSPIIKTSEEASKISPLYLDMVEDAVIVYDKNEFFRKIQDTVKKRLEKLGSKKIVIGKRWYWVLKPDYQFGEVIKIG